MEPKVALVAADGLVMLWVGKAKRVFL
jgi:hypothetical protein